MHTSRECLITVHGGFAGRFRWSLSHRPGEAKVAPSWKRESFPGDLQDLGGPKPPRFETLPNSMIGSCCCGRCSGLEASIGKVWSEGTEGIDGSGVVFPGLLISI